MKPENALWTEKYRPSDFSEIKGQKEIVKRVKAFVEQQNLPHLMFAGPAGVGKTSLALVIAKKLFKDIWRQNFLELNASVTGDTPVLVRENGKIKRTDLNDIAKKYFQYQASRVSVDNLEVLSIDEDYKVVFSNVNYVFRHKTSRIANIKFEGGNIKTSLNHSLIIFDKEGNLKSIKAEELKKGDHLITFNTKLEGNANKIDLSRLSPRRFSKLKSGLQLNQTVKVDYTHLVLDTEMSWALGLYAAEGCTSMGKTSGQTIYTLAYPQETKLSDRLVSLFENKGLQAKTILASSGFDRSKKSSQQVRLFNTQLTKFMRENFYSQNSTVKRAVSKRIPSFIFEAGLKQRLSFLEGYHRGDGSGVWNEVARLSSVSQDCLIDAAWLARISGVESSCFPRETRLIWKNPKFSYIKSELLPADIFHNLLKSHKLEKTYLLRHSLYSKKSKRISKRIAVLLLTMCKDNEQLFKKVRKLVNSNISVVTITDVRHENYNDYVYDFSVPSSQMFWGGTIPILLHNSDERGIDVVRNKVKDFARTRAIGDVPFKIIYLDECDALTREAQQALRRTMENYTQTCRFILSANFSSKIIEPIQSRCVIFRFKLLDKKDIFGIIERIAEEEKLKIDEKAKEALYETCEGDCRNLENILQSAAAITNHITEDLVHSMASVAKPKEIHEVLELALNNEFIKARSKLLDIMLNYGLAGIDIIKQIQKEILGLNIDNKSKMLLIEKCGEIEFRMTEGSDEFVQLEALLSQFALAGSNS